MFLHSSDQPPMGLCRLYSRGWNAIQPVPSFPARMPPPGSKPCPVLRGPGGQEAGDHGCLPGHLPPAPCAHQCPRLQPAAWGEMPRQKAGLQPGVGGEVPTVCSVKAQTPVALPSNRLYDTFSRIPSPNSQPSVSNWGSRVEDPNSPAPEYQLAPSGTWVPPGDPLSRHFPSNPLPFIKLLSSFRFYWERVGGRLKSKHFKDKSINKRAGHSFSPLIF